MSWESFIRIQLLVQSDSYIGYLVTHTRARTCVGVGELRNEVVTWTSVSNYRIGVGVSSLAQINSALGAVLWRKTATKSQSVSCVDPPTHAVNNNARLLGFVVIQNCARLLNATTSTFRGVPGERRLQLRWVLPCREHSSIVSLSAVDRTSICTF